MYYLDYSIKTINGLVKSAQTKYILQNGSIDSKLNIVFKNNMADVADVSFEKEFQKINLYLFFI